MKRIPLPPSFAPDQRGASRPLLLAGLVVLALAAGGLWWKYGPRDAATGGPMAGASAAGSAAGPGGPGGPGGGANRRFAGANRVQPVSVMAVRQQDMRVLVTAIGNIAALNTALVRTKADGELKAIRFKEGQTVKAGQVLAEIDARSYEATLAQAQGQLARDQAQLVNARLDLQRYKDLLAKDSIASQQVDTQAALVRQLEGTVQADQATVDSAKLQLSYTKVTAPISGRLGLKQADLGNVVHASDATGIVTITQVQPIAVVFAVPEANLPQIAAKLKAGEPMMVEAWDREQRNRLGTGKVSTTDNAIDTTTGTIKLKAEFANADGTLFPNQFANIRLQVDTLKGALAVPTAAVQRGAQGTFVYVVKEDSSVTVRRVRLGTTENDWVSVQGDIAAGEKVVTDGADRLREGAKVEVITAASRQSAMGIGADGQRTRRNGAGMPGGAASGAAGVAGATAPAPGASATNNPADAPAARSERPRSGGSAPAAGGASPQAAGASGTANAAGANSASADGGERPRWMDRLPPEMVERVKAMSPEERQAFFQKLRERRQQREQQGQSN